MPDLKDILLNLPEKELKGDSNIAVEQICIDSRQVKPQSLFVALKGASVDGHQYIDKAISSGANSIVCETLPAHLQEHVCYIQVPDVHVAVGLLAAAFYSYPSLSVKVVAVTGTNGKTTVATLLYRLFKDLGYKSGLISTVENYINDNIEPATHTTPDAVSLQALLDKMRNAQCEYVFMEASSHAIHQHRIAGILFTGAIFTNISHDHLDYHKTFDEYIKVKKALFDNLPATAFTLVNADDKRGAIMLQNTKAAKNTYSLRVPATIKGKILENSLSGLLMQIDKQETYFKLIGNFNAYNLLAVYGAATLLGLDKIAVLTALSNIRGAAGRFETYRSENEKILGIVDYAHTPDALLNVLTTIRQLNSEGRTVITIVGCGGDRDKTKRPVMAEVACEHSTRVILTSDNPRSENPEDILNDMEATLTFAQKRKVIRISDRKEAIKTAISLAQAEDIILLAGKGHETYQEINGVKHHFDDKEVLLEMFHLLNK